MDRSYVKENTRERVRLRRLVNEISDKELELVIYKEGWTIATALAHLAFWDERRLALVRGWQQKGVTPSGMNDLDTQTLNDALVPFFLAIPPRKAAELSILIAENLDKELEKLPAEIIQAIEALGDRHALNRGIHRKMHLDEIEAFLKTRRKSK